MREMTNRWTIQGLVLIASLGLGACATPGNSFAPETQPIPAKALQERLTGRTYTARVASGVGWEMRYEANGRMQMTMSNGTADGGRRRTEDGRLCIEFDGSFSSGCSEVRADAKRLYLKRVSSGEVVVLNAAP